MSEMSQATRAMLRDAQTDAPPLAARAKIWNGVATATKIASSVGAGAAMSSGATSTAGASVKTLTLGGIFGGTLTVGLALMMLKITSVDVSLAAEMHMQAAIGAAMGGSAPMSSGTPAAMAPETTDTQSATPIATPIATTTAIATAPSTRLAKPAPVRDATEDPLMREASLLAEARSALARGDAAGSLRLVRAARGLPSHQLAPEELALEAQALRALGRADEASTADDALRRSYPDHALAR